MFVSIRVIFFYVSNLLWIWADGNVPDLIAIQFKYSNWLRIFISRGSQWNGIQVVFKWSSFSARVFILFEWICLELICDRRHSVITIINYWSARRSWISSRRFTLKFQKSILIAKIKKKQWEPNSWIAFRAKTYMKFYGLVFMCHKYRI